MSMPRTACPAPLEGGPVGIRPILLAAPFMALLVVSVASAEAPVAPQPPATALATPDPCEGHYTQWAHGRYVRAIYRTRIKIRKRARRRLKRMKLCSFSAEATRNMRQLERHEARARRARKAVDAAAVAIPPHLHAIAACESGGNPGAVSPSGQYRGKYQFDYRTWRGVGGVGDPAAASESEQDMRAAMLYRQRGAQPWPVCGR
jgi:Transglycosylase-like domain